MRLGDQFLKRTRLRNDKIKDLAFPLTFFLGLEDGRQYWDEAVKGDAALEGQLYLIFSCWVLPCL